MKRIIPIVLIIFVFFASSFTKSGQLLAHIDKMYYLQGKVGGKSLYLKIKCYDEFPVRYMNCFFEDDKMDQFFIGEFNKTAWEFISSDDQNKHRSLVIKEEQNGAWKGKYTDNTGKITDILLEPLLENTNSKYNNFSKLKRFDPYEAYKISKVNLAKIKTKKISEVFSLDYYKENESGITLFRIQSENKKIKLDSVNNVLEGIQLSFIQDYYLFNANRKTLTIESEILYLNEALISFKVISNSTFKTQNPIKSQLVFSLDLETGRQLDLESILWLDNKDRSSNGTNISETYQYRKKVFAPFIFSVLNELYPDKIKTNNCDLNKEITWALPNFAVTKQGLSFYFSHSSSCNNLEWAVIPYEKLAPFLNKKYKLDLPESEFQF